jgi:uncharacterized circularly permuted ATP-grasp superfamily protein/uncharacterized alpha-E superfamily protein
MRSATNMHEPMGPWRLFDGYQPLDGVYDEMFAAPGRLRAHCEPLARSLDALGRHELASRWENAKRTIRDNGVTYNVYGDPQGGDRPWALDLMPLVIPPDEWTRLEAAVLQRTRLLNAILADIYGPRRLLRDDLLPPSLILASPGFLRPCHGIAVPHGIHLHMHAVDLARSPDGRWSVLADRTQAPAGAGYALENRIVISRTLPEAFRDCRVQRLASFFRAQRDQLIGMAASQRDDPRVVLLTPGPHDETYFEHAYLARYLGFTLVESGDLTVRDCRVVLKTLEGLQPVDVIVRRLDDGLCDPLELRPDSGLGVAGLVEAARAGTVAIANALGSGVIETVALGPFLPNLSRHLLGEDLKLPSVASWWCGQADGLQYVLDHLDRLVIWRAFPPGNRHPIFGRMLGAADRAALADEIRARPEQFVGRAEVALSTTPVWAGTRIEPRPCVLKLYAAAAGDGYTVMPGGLTRVAGTGHAPIVSMQRGSGSKDTWVMSDGPVSTVSLLAPARVPIRREPRGHDLPSRVADNLFWLGRYAERAEHRVRLLRSLVACLIDEDTVEDTPELLGLLHLLGELDVLPPHLKPPVTLRTLERELSFLFKQSPHIGTRQTLQELRRFATAVRDRLSLDTWRILNQLRQDFRIRHGRTQFPDVLIHLNGTIADLAAFSGMEMENMTRGHGWRFLDAGRRLERAVNMTTLLCSTLRTGALHEALLRPLLEIADSAMTYRRRYFAQPQLVPVLDLLLADSTNARALAFQLAALADHIEQLPRNERAPIPTEEQRLIAHAIDTLRGADLDILSRPEPELSFPRLMALLDSIQEDMKALSDAITYYYFSHAEQRVS